MGVNVVSAQPAKTPREDPQRSAQSASSHGAGLSFPTPIHKLQRAVGNRALSSLLRTPMIQPKLTVSRSDDQYEREADRVADQVMRMAEGQSPTILRIGNIGMVQRKCACGGGNDEPCSCDQVQRHAVSSSDVSSIPTAMPDVLRSAGQPLDGPTRSFMESRFGQDFSTVRVHTGGEATDSARSFKAHAYTVGNHVVFGANQYQPATAAGRHLLAHELTHVLQQESTKTMRLQRRATCTAGVLTDPRCTDAQGSGHPGGVNLEHFDQNQFRLKSAHRGLIRSFIAVWRAGGSTDNVRVHGYASCDGQPNANAQLSCNRAETVKTELVSGGVSSTITTDAHGETDEFGASLDANRRVIIERVAPPPPPPTPPPPSPPPTPPPSAPPQVQPPRDPGTLTDEECALQVARGLGTTWLAELPNCPCTTALVESENTTLTGSSWEESSRFLGCFHPGAARCFRRDHRGHAQQCCYDGAGDLITDGAAAGTPDFVPSSGTGHQSTDVWTWRILGWERYDQFWVPNNGNGCRGNTVTSAGSCSWYHFTLASRPSTCAP